MLTEENVVRQIFDDLDELLGLDERLEVGFLPNGNLYANLVDERDGGHAASGLVHVINVLAARLK